MTTDEQSETVHCDAVVVGGSYAGLITAIALDTVFDGAISITLIDAAPVAGRQAAGGSKVGGAGASNKGDPRATAMTAASKRMLQRLGVWDALEDTAQAMEQVDLTDTPLDAAVRPVLLHYDNHDEDDEPASWMVENSLLKSALVERLATCKRVDVLAPVRVTSIPAASDGMHRRVMLDNGDCISASIVIAADGRQSPVRKMAGIKTVGWSYPQMGIVTNVRHELPHHGTAVQHFLPGGPFAILPLKGNRASLVWTEAKDVATDVMAMDDDDFLSELTHRFGRKLGRIELDGPRAAWPLDMHIARQLVADHLVLVGDAAHGVHPLAGQGLNIALSDIAALADCLYDGAKVGSALGDAQALERYQQWRRFDSVMSAFAMEAINRLFSNDSDVLRTLRDIGFGVLERLPGAKAQIVKRAAGPGLVGGGETPTLCAPI